MISFEDYMMGRDVEYPPTDDLVACAEDLVDRIALLEVKYNSEPLVITSGYRPPAITDTIPHAVHGDAHEKCQGIDLKDPDKKLSTYLLANLAVLEELGLWLESPISAHDHVHLQTYPPKSGKRVFIA